jgi:hypothetical protein
MMGKDIAAVVAAFCRAVNQPPSKLDNLSLAPDVLLAAGIQE